MLRTSLRAVIIGTLIFLSLLGLGLAGLRPAFELAIVFSVPSIYAVGPLMNFFPYDWFEGPPGGVAAIMISSWLELMAISVFIGVIWNRIKQRSADQKHQGD
jgi:hypothetical protein